MTKCIINTRDQRVAANRFKDCRKEVTSTPIPLRLFATSTLKFTSTRTSVSEDNCSSSKHAQSYRHSTSPVMPADGWAESWKCGMSHCTVWDYCGLKTPGDTRSPTKNACTKEKSLKSRRYCMLLGRQPL